MNVNDVIISGSNEEVVNHVSVQNVSLLGGMTEMGSVAENESEVRRELELDGWDVYRAGRPDFICFKNGKVKFVEAKYKYAVLSEDQEILFKLMREHGLEVEIITNQAGVSIIHGHWEAHCYRCKISWELTPQDSIRQICKKCHREVIVVNVKEDKHTRNLSKVEM